MYVFLVCNILLVEMIHIDLLLAVGGAKELEEIALKLATVVLDVLFGIFADEEHLPHMRFGLSMAFEAVLIAHLALTYLSSKRC